MSTLCNCRRSLPYLPTPWRTATSWELSILTMTSSLSSSILLWELFRLSNCARKTARERIICSGWKFECIYINYRASFGQQIDGTGSWYCDKFALRVARRVVKGNSRSLQHLKATASHTHHTGPQGHKWNFNRFSFLLSPLLRNGEHQSQPAQGSRARSGSKLSIFREQTAVIYRSASTPPSALFPCFSGMCVESGLRDLLENSIFRSSCTPSPL